MADSSGLNSITRSEHISPEATGDNIGAKRSALYAFDGTNWQRVQIDANGNIKTIGSITNDGTFATPARQDTGNTSLANIDANTSKDASTFTFYSQALSAVGTITPANGKSVQIEKVLVTNSSNNTTFRNVTLSSVSKGTFLQGEAIACSWKITLAVNEVLTITPSGGTVYVNIQYREV